MSTRRQRSEFEIESDRLFLIAAMRAAGPDVPVSKVGEILNDRRAEAARSAALAAGRSPEEAEQAATDARISTRAIARDVATVLERVRDAGNAGAAVLLDEQIADCRRDIDATYAVDESVLADLERSRRRSKVRTLGRVEERGAAPVPVEIVTEREDSLPGDAALYAILQANIEKRIRLRTEMRTLRFGRAFMPRNMPDGEIRSLAESVAGADLRGAPDPRSRALELYEREIAALGEAEQIVGPLSPELAALERTRIQRQASRVRHLREFISLADKEGAGRRGFEIVVTNREIGGKDAATP